MRRAIVVTGKHGIAALTIVLKEAEIKSEAIPVHMNQKNTEKQQLKDKNETPTEMVHAGHINKTTTLPLPTDQEWRQTTSEYHNLG